MRYSFLPILTSRTATLKFEVGLSAPSPLYTLFPFLPRPYCARIPGDLIEVNKILPGLWQHPSNPEVPEGSNVVRAKGLVLEIFVLSVAVCMCGGKAGREVVGIRHWWVGGRELNWEDGE